MLQPEYPPSVRSIEGGTEAVPSSEAFKSALEFIRRQYRVIAFSAAIAVAMGAIYVLTSPPSFTATATMIIDSKNIHLFQQQSMFNDMPLDTGNVESQVEILKSETVSLAVIKQLHLTEDPEFISSGGGLIGTVLGALTGLFASNGPSSEFALTRNAVSAFQGRLNVRRVGLTRFGGRKFLRELDGFIDHDFRRRSSRAQFINREAQDIPVDRRQPVQPPVCR